MRASRHVRAVRLVAALVLLVPTGRAWADEALTLIVMDPLAAPLSCPCVEGYAQREYPVLAASLAEKLGREVRIGFGESVERGQRQAGDRPADIVIGKDSVVRADAAGLGVAATPVARLTGLRGETTQTGLIVVRSDDPATSVGELGGYRVFFGPAECDEKHAAALELLTAAGVALPPAQRLTSNACSDGASKVVELGPDVRSAAVISSYAQPLLEGCGTIQKGDLRVVGETAPLPFVTAFVTDRVDAATRAAITEALLAVVAEPQTLLALESLVGFTPIDEDYDRLIEPRAPAVERADPRGPADNVSWPGWGGPRRDWSARWLPASLPERVETVWRRPLGRSGLGGVAVVDGRVVLGDRDPANVFDVWRCYDAETGETLWETQYPALGRLDYDNAPRATPLIADGRAYLLGAFGQLSCVAVETGELLWRRDLRVEYLATGELVWGLCASPLLVDGRLIVSPGADDAAWVALDPETGAELWRAAGDRHGFASPIVATLGGVRQLVAYDRTSLGGWRIDTGEPLWKLSPPRPGDFNVPTPLVVGGRLFAVSENNGGRLYDCDEGGRLRTEAASSWPDLRPDTSSPVALGDRVLCVWGDLFCLDAAGALREAWIAEDRAYPTTGAAVVGRTDDGAARLLVVGRGGELLLVDPDAAGGGRVVSRLSPFGAESGDGEELLTLPAIVGDRLYLRGDDALVCVRLAG